MKKQVVKDALWVDCGVFTVFRDGRIFTNNWRGTGKTKELKQSVDSEGYLVFSKEGKTTRAHRFIAECFISNPDNLPQINHKSESRKDKNDVLSLEWCDSAYNNNFGTRNERIKNKQINDIKKSKKVLQYTIDGEFIREWPSIQEVQRQLDWPYQSISACCRGKQKTAYGYVWRYAE